MLLILEERTDGDGMESNALLDANKLKSGKSTGPTALDDNQTTGD